MPYLFHGQRSDEEVILLSRQHPFVLFHPFLISSVILLIPFVANIFLVFGSLLSWILIVTIVAALAHAILAWYSWYNSIFLLTNQRVVVLEQRHVMHREFTECGLKSIQQVSHEVRGLYHTLWGYGNITIYTGGSPEPFRIPNIPNPYDIQQEILRVATGEGFLEVE